MLVRPALAEAEFLHALRGFSFDGAVTEEVERDGLRYFVNAFWTSAQRRAHSLHEVSYRACFKPQLPEFFIARLTAPGETVYDPFAGRGTTALQAALMGRRPAANDISPLSALLCRPRLAPPTLPDIAARLDSLDLSGAAVAADDPLLTFFHPDTLTRIRALRDTLLAREAAGGLDAVDDWIRMVALNRLTGHSPGFFSVYTLPPNQATSVVAQRRINARRAQVPPPRDVKALILRKSRGLLAHGATPPHPPALLLTGPADATPALGDGSVALIVTSPPFLDVVDYQADNWLRCWFAGIDAAAVPHAHHHSIAAWEGFVRGCLAEFARVLRPGGLVAFEVGEVRRGKVLLEHHVAAAMAGLPFDPLGVMVNRQTFTKTANCWGVDNNAGGTNTNRIVLARRRC
jgi:hypothetical protein